MQENLWSFAVRQYGKPAVAPLYLAWQERFGADINLLLAGFWLAAQRRLWSADTVGELQCAVEHWRVHAVLPLRAARRALNSSALYPMVKVVELEAEQVQLNIIAAALSGDEATTDLPGSECAHRNLLAYAATLGTPPDAAAIGALLATLDHYP
jgi:uncharacterized protein (TIGR02444 family)